MANADPSTKPFKLPEDVTTLSQMRDQLSDYLNTLERNTDAINLWLQNNQKQLILGHHDLIRAVKYDKDEQAALKVLASFGDAAGFVLSTGDFKAMAETSFGAASPLKQAIEKIELGVPPKILEALPDIRLPDADAPKPVVKAPPPPPAPEPEPETKWWQVSSWFKGKPKDQGPSQEEIDAENRRREEELRRHWRLVRGELIALQSDRHYYVDSFMDWIGETLAPANGNPSPETDKLMDTYENPQFVIDRARKDYSDVIDVKAQGVRQKAIDYSKIAELIDQQKIPEFAALLPSLFPATETTETKQLKEYLLEDFGVTSFAEMALDKARSRKDQLLLLETALKLEPEFRLSGAGNRRDIFDRVFRETTAQDDPLDSRALQLTLDKLKKGKNDDLADLIGLKQPRPKTVFEAFLERFTKDLGEVARGVGRILSGLAPARDSVENDVAEVMDGVRGKDGAKLAHAFGQVEKKSSGPRFMALWELMHPPGSAPITQQIIATAKDKAELASLTDKALSAGVLDELKANSNAAQGSVGNFLKFFNDQVMSEPGAFSITTARRLVASSLANGGVDRFRTELTKTGGWLQQVMQSKLDNDGKLNWTAALLEPFASDVAKANVLFEAASAKGADASASAALLNMEANLAGTNVRLGDGRIMTNLDRIANIWYNADSKLMRYTVNGTGHTFMEGLSPVQAREVLSLVQRKGGFLAEYDGIFKPENIDRIQTNQNGTKITWNRNSGELNVDGPMLKELHSRPDYVHVTDGRGNTLSINQRSVTLLQPLSDGTHLLVDRYGNVQIVEGKVDVKAQGGLLDLSGTFINPSNASILSLNASKNTVEFRCESNDFEDLLESAAPGQYFYPVELAGAADFQKLKQAVDADAMIQAPGGKSLQDLHFNMGRLGYMMFTDQRDVGFTCRKYGPARKPGFISAEEDLAKNIFSGLSGNGGLVSIENVITHKDCIDDAYYNADKQQFYMLIGNDILQIPCDETHAYDLLKKLSKEDGFTVVGANYLPKAKGAGTVEVPADVVHMDRATMLFYSAAQDRSFIIAENEKFPISLDEKQSRDLFGLLEQDGLKAAQAATAGKAAWTQGLRAALDALPSLNVKLAPSLTELGREYLLDQVIGTPSETKPMPSLQEDFSVAAQAVKAKDSFTYPRRERGPQAKAPKP